MNVTAEDDPLADSARWLLKTLSVGVAGLCLYTRGATGAYVFLFMFPFYIAISIFHCIQHFRALSQNEPLSRALIKQLLLSHLLFITAFLLQYDYADGRNG